MAAAVVLYTGMKRYLQKRWRSILPGGVVFFLLLQAASFAQEPEDPGITDRIWGNLSGGIALSNDLNGLGAAVSITYEDGGTLYSVRYAEARSIVVPGERFYVSRVSEVGVLYGYAAHYGWFCLAAQAGIGATWGEYHNDGQPARPFSTVGSPVQVQAALILTEELGIGLMVSGNVNPRAAYAVAALTIQMGQLGPWR